MPRIKDGSYCERLLAETIETKSSFIKNEKAAQVRRSWALKVCKQNQARLDEF